MLKRHLTDRLPINRDAALISFNVNKTKRVYADNFQFCTKPMLAMLNVLTLIRPASTKSVSQDVVGSACPKGIPSGSAWLAGVRCVFNLFFLCLTSKLQPLQKLSLQLHYKHNQQTHLLEKKS